ncbi:PREDICTED: jmjC domain-containing protein 4 [Condylura cristata]|uniref:jmjC domain-containing protein 4 n=1 Tax=Condylura cristata TaxID=143302 RepID=UPI000643709D|nr:PREDICTED: jmjC domain-containing protein 4 [Condylura cristata]
MAPGTGPSTHRGGPPGLWCSLSPPVVTTGKRPGACQQDQWAQQSRQRQRPRVLLAQGHWQVPSCRPPANKCADRDLPAVSAHPRCWAQALPTRSPRIGLCCGPGATALSSPSAPEDACASLASAPGDMVVPVANCGLREYNANPKEHMPLRDYISYWREHIQGGYASPRGCLYLKDWHLCRDASSEEVFSLPVYFSSDWLNEYWDAVGRDDYRFVYMGPAGSWSPFHADIFRSYSWSVNICGRKKWLLFPPGQEEALRDRHGGLPYDVTVPALRERGAPPLEVTQEAGEMVFVPSGWHHQVHNLEDTISVNHNWVNGCNLASMWHFLQQELQAVQREVAEWRDAMPDWHHHCQVILRACSGINFEEFYQFLKVIAERRLCVFTDGGPEDASPGLGPQQAAFDIGRIAEVLASLVAHPDFQKVDTGALSPQPGELLQRLEESMATFAAL